MELLEIIKSRRSIRNYKNKPVEEENITKILEAARWAPSGLNNQPWKFIIVQNSNTIKQISKFTKYSYIIEKAPSLIVVLLDKNLSYNREKDIQAIGACIQNMLLMCHSLGLGACWIGEILNRKEEVEKFLGIPNHLELMAVITIGYPYEEDIKTSSNRKNLEELIIKKI
ncbi:MAG: nitroreductase [Elusimicrobiota bacterium]|nr:nitroreductase [Endomicrobiia bacterium]MCX7910291.1 nitroreductase [Endomicrobiia bacterium]MDW8165777.1 nitroreductase [Elusimicrobiota bacterium]